VCSSELVTPSQITLFSLLILIHIGKGAVIDRLQSPSTETETLKTASVLWEA
jgi:hypothetical protein